VSTPEDHSPAPEDAPSLAMRRLLDRPMDPAVLDENTTLVAQPHETVDADRFDLLVARIGDEHLGFDAMLVHRVHDPAVIRRVPHRHAEHLAGIAAVDGDIVPAARLGPLLGIDGDVEPVDPRVILIGPAERRWAVPVDAIVGVHQFTRSSVIDSPTTVSASLRRHVSGLVRLDGRFVAIVDGERLLAALDGGLR
jgi:two-component system chemotaxis response regulator CheV